jgi:hypothetical protein
MNKMGLLQDESEGYEPQRLSRWFASRLDAREVVRNNFRKELTNVREWELYNDQPSREG